MESVATIERNIAQSIGTEKYIKHGLCPGLVFTDGVNQLRQDADCFWLVDAIASYRRKEEFQVWELKVAEDENGIRSAVLTMKEDSDQPVLVKQEFLRTDFPLDSIKFFVQLGGYGPDAENWTECMVLMLPNEY